MKSSLMQAKKMHLLVVDMQARLLPVIHEHDQVAAAVGRLITAAETLKIPVTVSEQYPKGLGHTDDTLSDALTGAKARTLTKDTFSIMGGSSLEKRCVDLRSKGRDQIIVCGIEAHICVLQSCLDLAGRGFDVFVVADAVGSRKPASRDVALSRLAHAGVTPVTSEMVMFEALGKAGTQQFKAISALVKDA